MRIRYVIVEDEPAAAKRLESMITKEYDHFERVKVLDSVEDSVLYFSNHPDVDLVFMDVQLGDGHSFEIFKKLEFDYPVIFTTAFNEYAVKAFEVNSIHYLLKPIEDVKLREAVNKFLTQNIRSNSSSLMKLLLDENMNKDFRKRFLVKKGSQLVKLTADEISYFYSEDGYSHILTKSGERFIVDFTMDQLEEQMDPQRFYRISRKMIVDVDAIDEIHTYFNNRLKLKLSPKASFDVIVSRDRVKEFKLWLGEG